MEVICDSQHADTVSRGDTAQTVHESGWVEANTELTAAEHGEPSFERLPSAFGADTQMLESLPSLASNVQDTTECDRSCRLQHLMTQVSSRSQRKRTA